MGELLLGGGMDFRDYLAETLFDLAHAVYVKPTMEELCQFLAIRICPSGEVSRVYVGRLDSDGIIRTEGSFGYSINIGIGEKETLLGTSRPMTYALQTRQVYVANREEVTRDFPEYIPLDRRSPWIATAAVPTLGRHVFVFRLQYCIEDKEPITQYFKAAGSLLSFYDFKNAQPDTRILTKAKLPKELFGQPLTPRQTEILEFINERKTNIQIADSLGYSESLIKQESMIIYAKLGVKGRQEILHPAEQKEQIRSIN